MHNAAAPEAQKGSCTLASVNYCLSFVVAKMDDQQQKETGSTDLKAMHQAGSGCSVASNGLDWEDSQVSSQPLPCAVSSGWR